ncbi:MAG: hypothetical protein U1E59_14245 [Amaricoccus sp.]
MTLEPRSESKLAPPRRAARRLHPRGHADRRLRPGRQPSAYAPGEAFVEAFGTDHDGRNDGAVPVRLLAVYMGAQGIPNSVMRGAQPPAD